MSRKHSTQARAYERKADDRTAITPIEYGGLQEAFEHFNAALFDGALPDVFITYQRKANSIGYFSPDRFSGRIGTFGKHELALNPDGFISQTDEQICQTLVHEMAHVWQHAYGKPSKRGYHNKEWAAKMKAIGLQPSSTGMVGGKETGQRMMDYIIPGGPFTRGLRQARRDWMEAEPAIRASAGGEGGAQQDEVHLPELRIRTCGASRIPRPPARPARLKHWRPSLVRHLLTPSQCSSVINCERLMLQRWSLPRQCRRHCSIPFQNQHQLHRTMKHR